MTWLSLRDEVAAEFATYSAYDRDVRFHLEQMAERRRVRVAERASSWYAVHRLDPVWRERNRARRRALYRQRKRVACRRQPVVCRECEACFVPLSNGRFYCGSACRRRNMNRRKRIRYRKLNPTARRHTKSKP
jgi:hypothetical protein